ncbi:MAG: hypothetical protein GXO97_08450 [Nitrospirae bacterium]|nr:hypothetical protein [Nitrospirota bacterium]
MNYLKNNKGFTLTELLIIIAIMVALLSLAGYAYNAYMVRYNIEKEIKEIYADLMTARMRALQQNQQYLIQFGTSSYTTYIDNDEDGQLDNPGDTLVGDLSKSGLSYNLAWNFGSIITFDSKGLSNVNGSVWISLPNNKPNDSEYDCINISRTRIKMGKRNGANCINR